MDRLVRKLSMAVATKTTRRGFIAQMVRGAVGAGLGAGFLFGGSRFALADANCTNKGPTVEGNSGCNGSTACPGGDANGCRGFDPLYCSDCEGNSCGGENYQAFGHWTCCCSKKLTTCLDCGAGGTAACICSSTGDAC